LLNPGTKLRAFEIVSTLGAGGMGEVYRARDTKLGRDVALKVLPADVARDPERLARFQREARSVAALNHPSIVTIHSVEEADGIHFITMELVEGKSLDHLIPAGGLPADQIVAIASALAEALAAAHEKGIIHRDLKPANVMVTGDGRVKVLDFGLAKETRPASHADATLTSASNTKAGVVMGTPAYMSPEQISGRALDHRTDIFSLGVVIYEMATGQRPFEGQSSAELISAIMRDTPALVTDLRADLPAHLANLIRLCMEKRADDRFPSAQSVWNELRGWTSDSATIRMPKPSASRAPTQSGSAEHPLAPVRPSTKGGSGEIGAQEGFWVAVLPFRVQGGDAELEAMADGLTEDITSGLSRFPYLKVVAYNSAMTYKGRPADIRTVGRELGARYVVEGSVRKRGRALRTSAQLLDAATGTQLWADAYDREVGETGTFQIQDDLTDHIVTTVADGYGVLVRSMAAPTRDKNVGDLSASELVLRYYSFMQQVNPPEHAMLRDGLERALEREPNHATAWACLCNLYLLEYFDRFNPRENPLERAREAAWRSVKIDPACQMGLAQLAQVQFFSGDFGAFRETAERAMSLNPRDGTTWAFMAIMIAFSGDWERGTALAQRITELNGHHPGWYHLTAFHNHYRKGEYDAALQVAKKINMPEFHWAQLFTAATCGMLGRPEEARAAIELLRKYNAMFLDLDQVREDLDKWHLEKGEVEKLLQGLRKAGLNMKDEPQPAATSPASIAPSIAVLPFKNMSPDPDQEYFADGLAEEIINLLARVPGLKVIARTSAFAFRGKEQDIRGIASALGVGTVLEGSLRRAGNRIRVTAQLINAADGAHVWSESYDREMTGVFALQDEIAAAITAALRIRLAPEAGVRERYTPKLDAYEAYLKAKYQEAKTTPESFKLSKQYYEQAIALDSGFALAHVGLSHYYLMLANWSLCPAQEAVQSARRAAERALQLDSSIPEAHAILGVMAAYNDLDWQEAARHFDRARGRQPVSAFVREFYGYFQFLRGESQHAIKIAEQLIQDDPLEVWPRMNLHAYLQAAGRYAEAREQVNRVLELNPNLVVARVSLAMFHADRGSLPHALEEARRAYAVGPWYLDAKATLAAFWRRSGAETEAQELLKGLGSGDGVGESRAHAVFHLLCGEVELGADWTEKAIEQRDLSMMFYLRFVVCKQLRASARWPKIAKMVNLPEGKV